MLESCGQHGGRQSGQRPIQEAGVCAETGMAIKGSQGTQERARERKLSGKREQDIQRHHLGFIKSKLIK